MAGRGGDGSVLPRQIMFLGCSALHFIIAKMVVMERRREVHMSQVLLSTQLRRGSTSMKSAHMQHVNSTCSDRMPYTFLHKREAQQRGMSLLGQPPPPHTLAHSAPPPHTLAHSAPPHTLAHSLRRT